MAEKTRGPSSLPRVVRLERQRDHNESGLHAFGTETPASLGSEQGEE